MSQSIALPIFFWQWMGEAKVRNGCGQTVRTQYVGCLHRLFESRTQLDNGDLLAFPKDTALANRKPLRDGRQCGSGAISARIANVYRTSIVKGAGMHHMNQLDLVRRSHTTMLGRDRKSVV